MKKLGRKLSNLLLILAITAVLLLLTYKLHLYNIMHLGLYCDKDIQYDRNMSLIIIGGVHRSGADLLRAMLDAHSEVRCDEEIFVNSLVFNIMKDLTKKEQPILDQVGVTKNVLEAAVAAFFLETLALGGKPARRLCTNSKFMLTSADNVSQILPKAKFIYVVRDGRAVVHSIISNEIMFHGYSISNPRASLKCWNIEVYTMYKQCKLVGNRRCMIVHYEELVLQPESSMKQILSFLEVPWDESVLNYWKKYKRGFVLKNYIASDPSGPINVDRLTTWIDQFPLDLMEDMDTIAPMLVTLGYDTRSNPPNYLTLQPFLLHK